MSREDPVERSPKHLLSLAVAFPVLLIGLSCVVLPVLDMAPIPGSSQQGFFEWWIPGFPLTWLGMRLLRFGIRGSAKGRTAGSEPLTLPKQPAASGPLSAGPWTSRDAREDDPKVRR